MMTQEKPGDAPALGGPRSQEPAAERKMTPAEVREFKARIALIRTRTGTKKRAAAEAAYLKAKAWLEESRALDSAENPEREEQ